MAQIKADEITKLIREQIDNYETKIAVDEVGTVMSIGDGIARVYGLDKVMAGELLSFPHNVAGHRHEPGRRPGRRGAAGRIHRSRRGRRGEAHRPHHERAGGRRAGRPRGQLAGPAHRRQGADQHRSVHSRRASRARRHRSPAGERAHGHRTEGHRLHDSDRPRPARADHRRPPDRQDRGRARHHHQQQGPRPDLYLLRDRAEAFVGGAGGEDAGRLRRDGIHHRRVGVGVRSRSDAVHRALRRVRHGRVSSATPSVTRCASTTIFPSTPSPIAKSRCCCAVRRDAKPIPATCSISTRACWSAPPS